MASPLLLYVRLPYDCILYHDLRSLYSFGRLNLLGTFSWRLQLVVEIIPRWFHCWCAHLFGLLELLFLPRTGLNREHAGKLHSLGHTHVLAHRACRRFRSLRG